MEYGHLLQASLTYLACFLYLLPILVLTCATKSTEKLRLWIRHIKTKMADEEFMQPYFSDEEELSNPALSAAAISSAITLLAAITTYDEYQAVQLKTFRKELARVMKLAERERFKGMTEEQFRDWQFEKRNDKKREQRLKAQQKKHVNSTQLRNGRIEALNSLIVAQEEVQKSTLLTNGGGETNEARGQLQYLVPDGAASDDKLSLAPAPAGPEISLNQARSCYCCKIRYLDLHHFYDQLCPACAALNWEKRFHSPKLPENYTALLTGARVKIGLRIGLKLLRAGATVIATSRFPLQTNKVYQEMGKDGEYERWVGEGRLHCFGVDLRDLASVEGMCQFITTKFERIDVIVNNACQTIRRPTGYYKPAVNREKDIFEQDSQSLLENPALQKFAQFEKEGAAQPNLMLESSSGGGEIAKKMNASGVSRSAALSLVELVPEDSECGSDVLPDNLTDINGQQLDLRRHNSWLLKIDSVSTPEIVEAMFVNVIAPFVINSRLIPLMTAGGESRPDRFIVNVSAMEGKFYRFKTANHPHTNMAKAALNMMTRTSSEDLSKQRIYMNSVDTGWINDENPLEKASATAENNNFQTPIDEIDAAARCLDPVFNGLATGKCVHGKFLKDYHESEW